MADRVVVPRGVPKRYVGIYEQIEDKQHPEPIALEFKECIGHEIRKNRGGVKKLINAIVPELEDLRWSLFRGDPDFKNEIFQKIREEKQNFTGDTFDTLHIECVKNACGHICNMLDNGDIADVPSEVNIQYHLNIFDARSDQIQMELLKKDEDRLALISEVRDRYEKCLRDPENYTNPKGYEDLLNTDITLI